MVKEQPRTANPKIISSIIASVGGLALFLILASTILVSQPIGSTVRGYFYSVYQSRKIDSLSTLMNLFSGSNSQYDDCGSIYIDGGDGKETVVDKKQALDSQNKNELSSSRQEEPKNLKDELPHSNVTQKETGSRSSASTKVTEE
ncbi:uncharacterized protein LOC111392643 [Olea europaea var. sylvestris]|uniref:uncharacterized protein LOC111392643 n=1 Tax=Olea europaea var. sylvestris TaxID=158386 RepID=UPI000C1D5362|nr:uncharacterized protein LOC111392643 [Olea europaea var. sylvestris]